MQPMMAIKDLTSTVGQLAMRNSRPALQTVVYRGVRCASGEAAPAKAQTTTPDVRDLEDQSAFRRQRSQRAAVDAYDPLKRAASRTKELPASRYQFRSPRYYRGPLHPHQPPPASDPASRVFVPGPFEIPRMEETYRTTMAPDLMTLMYTHKPPGTVKLPKADRLREWDDSSPYMKNRPKRGPRGGDVLRLIERDVDWRNIPKIEEVTVHCMVKGASDDSSYLHVAGMLLQSVTGVKPVVHRARKSVAQFSIREQQPISLTCTMTGNDAWAFVDKCVHLVFPRIKDWPGVKGSSGDSSGNIAWGFERDAVTLFPEVEVNYDMYPPKLIPGFHVMCKTTATSDRHARLLMSALGVPFYGEYVD